MPRERIPFAGLSQSLMPTIIQLAGERRAEQRRLRGEADITQAMGTFFQGGDVSPEERTAALSKLITSGAPVTGQMMQSLQPEQDIGPFLDKLGISKDDPARVLWGMGALSKQQLGADLLRTFKEGQEEEEFEESLQTLFDAGLVQVDGIEPGIDAGGKMRSQVDQLKAIADYKEKYGQKAGDVLMKRAGLMGSDVKWQGVLAQIDGGVSIEEMSASDRGLIVERITSPANQATLFAQRGDAAKMFEAGQRAIFREAEGLFGMWGLIEGLKAWTTGKDPYSLLTPQSVGFLQRNFDSFGNIKFDASVESGLKAFRAIEDLQTKINISAEHWDRIENILKMLQTIPEEEIDWSLVDREIANTGAEPADIRKWYREIMNAIK